MSDKVEGRKEEEEEQIDLQSRKTKLNFECTRSEKISKAGEMKEMNARCGNQKPFPVKYCSRRNRIDGGIWGFAEQVKSNHCNHCCEKQVKSNHFWKTRK